MKVNGQSISERTPSVLVIPRGEGQAPLVFYASPIASYEEFNKLCPAPKAPQRYTPKGMVDDDKSPAFVESLKEHSNRKWWWTIVTSLRPSNIEWESVNHADPATWPNAERELRALGHFGYSKIIELVEEANLLDPVKLNEARTSFFQLQAEAEKPSTPNSAVPSTQSGELASGSA